ncbi:MAG TPA: PDZ domain-containing protein [Myxococcales bacterium]|jgi:predicted metalloprotease with PDZ domain|nr:PDZ domain-containing protein [Myxococcales bacterium]
MPIVRMVAALALMIIVRPALAGDKYSCKAEAQACLDEMTAKLKNRGWVGIEMDVDEKTHLMSVKRVVEDSPAQAAGLKSGDVLVALNGVKLTEENEIQLSKAKETMVPGVTVTYTISRAGKDQQVPVKLGELPPQVLYQWIGQHMLEHHARVQLAAKTQDKDKDKK